jgi:hypothetical protein
MQGGAEVPVGEGYAHAGRKGQRGTEAGYDIHGYSRHPEREQFFPAPRENKRVSPFETRYFFAGPCFRYQNPVDFFLGNRVPAGVFSHVNEFYRGRQAEQDFFRNKPVVNNRVGKVKNGFSRGG